MIRESFNTVINKQIILEFYLPAYASALISTMKFHNLYFSIGQINPSFSMRLVIPWNCVVLVGFMINFSGVDINILQQTHNR